MQHPLRLAAALALVALAAGCAGPLTVSGPGILVSSDPAPPSGAQIEGMRVEKGMNATLTITSSAPEPGEDGRDDSPEGDASATAGDALSGSRAEEGNVSPRVEEPPPSPDPAPVADDPLIPLSAVLALIEAGQSGVIAGVDAARGILEAVNPVPAPELEPETPEFVGPPKPPDSELAAILREAEGDTNVPYEDVLGFWHIGIGHRIDDAEKERMFTEDMTEAEVTARRVLGDDAWNRLGRWRRNAWIVACYWGGCASYDEMKLATLSGDWEAAAREAQTRGLPTSWASINPERAAMLAHWLRTGEQGER